MALIQEANGKMTPAQIKSKSLLNANLNLSIDSEIVLQRIALRCVFNSTHFNIDCPPFLFTDCSELKDYRTFKYSTVGCCFKLRRIAFANLDRTGFFPQRMLNVVNVLHPGWIYLPKHRCKQHNFEIRFSIRICNLV